MEDRLKILEKEIQLVKERNQNVEINKAWEISLVRKLLILIITYIIAVIILYVIDAENYLLGAIIPTVGFYVSTLTVPFIKYWWVKKIYSKK